MSGEARIQTQLGLTPKHLVWGLAQIHSNRSCLSSSPLWRIWRNFYNWVKIIWCFWTQMFDRNKRKCISFLPMRHNIKVSQLSELHTVKQTPKPAEAAWSWGTQPLVSADLSSPGGLATELAKLMFLLTHTQGPGLGRELWGTSQWTASLSEGGCAVFLAMSGCARRISQCSVLQRHSKVVDFTSTKDGSTAQF